MSAGKILSFDDVRGYGFIVPDDGGADVFVHANELRDEKSAFKPGTAVEFDVIDSGRGPKAFSVRVAGGDEPEPLPDGASGLTVTHTPTAPAADDDGLCDVLAPKEFNREMTELFLESLPDLTGGQIVRLRSSLLVVARKHGWVEG